jgi:glycosyltransferase involved in cell wall biosynthesis
MLIENQKENILIIGPKNKKGGVATHVKNLLSYEPLEKAEVFDPGSLGTTSRENRSSIFKIFKSLWHLRRKTTADNYNVLINASIYPSSFFKLILILLFINRSRGESIFVYFHGGRFNEKFRTIGNFSWLYSIILRKVDEFFFLSEVQRKGFYERIGEYPASLYNNYSNSNEVWIGNTNKTKINFLFVGRTVKEKGIYELITSVRLLVEEGGFSNFKLNIVGDGKDYKNIVRKSNEMNLEPYIEFYGFLSGGELDLMYKKSDWFVLPTYEEGFPYVFIEAMQAGLPIITTKSGALKRLVKEEKNGFFVKPQCSRSLFDKMKYVLNLRPNLEKNCYSFFKEELSKKAAEKFYWDLLNK